MRDTKKSRLEVALMTPDAMCLALLSSRAILVDPATGTAHTTRCPHGVSRRLGCKNKAGYIVATLHHRGARKQVKVHRLVWLAANGPIPHGMMPDHKNRIRDDNRIDNLRLVDAKENARNRRSYRGEANPSARITQQQANAIRTAPGSYAAKATRFGVSKSLVAQISRGEIWT